MDGPQVFGNQQNIDSSTLCYSLNYLVLGGKVVRMTLLSILLRFY